MYRKIIKLLNKYWAILTILLACLIVTIFNLNIYWMLVDDGGNVVFARTLFEKIIHLNLLDFLSQLLEIGGRFRPVYWFYHVWVWLIGGNSFQFHHFAHMAVIGITVIFVYLILNELTKSKSISLFGSLFYLFIPLNTENIMRLGPQEPLVAMFFSILFYLLIKRSNIYLLCFVIILVVFTKETALAFLPVILFYYLYYRKNSVDKEGERSIKLLITTIVSSVILVIITFLRRSGYSTNYFFNIGMIVNNLVLYLNELFTETSGIFPLVVC
ncbi:MAG: hypothetical protein GYA62_13355, partial [Bacteroidales bacterium]|nr:hypothetical protein [Bacteroidales bacterium]